MIDYMCLLCILEFLLYFKFPLFRFTECTRLGLYDGLGGQSIIEKSKTVKFSIS